MSDFGEVASRASQFRDGDISELAIGFDGLSRWFKMV